MGVALRIRTLFAFSILSLSAPAAAGNLYATCFYASNQGGYSITQLFTLQGDALPAYGQWTYEKTLEWEQKIPDDMRGVSDYTNDDFVGQFVNYAEHARTSGGSSQALCLITTQKSRALAFYRNKLADGRFKESELRNWRPTRGTYRSVESWSGTTLGSAEPDPAPTTEAEQEQSPGTNRETASAPVPPRPKKSNAQADAEFAAAKAEYQRKLAQNAAEYKRAQEAVERKKAEQREAAKRVLADYQQQLQAHDRSVRDQQLEYQKMAAKPTEAPNAVFRGFTGANCDAARRSATSGAGTSLGTRFKEVAAATTDGHCVVQGWWWDTTATGASRQ